MWMHILVSYRHLTVIKLYTSLCFLCQYQLNFVDKKKPIHKIYKSFGEWFLNQLAPYKYKVIKVLMYYCKNCIDIKRNFCSATTFIVRIIQRQYKMSIFMDVVYGTVARGAKVTKGRRLSGQKRKNTIKRNFILFYLLRNNDRKKKNRKIWSASSPNIIIVVGIHISLAGIYNVMFHCIRLPRSSVVIVCRRARVTTYICVYNTIYIIMYLGT